MSFNWPMTSRLRHLLVTRKLKCLPANISKVSECQGEDLIYRVPLYTVSLLPGGCAIHPASLISYIWLLLHALRHMPVIEPGHYFGQPKASGLMPFKRQHFGIDERTCAHHQAQKWHHS
jgi:hypothetical protein